MPKRNLQELMIWQPSGSMITTVRGKMTYAAWCEFEADRINRIPGRKAEVRYQASEKGQEFCCVFADCLEVRDEK